MYLLLTALLATAQPSPLASDRASVERPTKAKAAVVLAKKAKKKGADAKAEKKEEQAPSATGDPRGSSADAAPTALPLDAVRQGPSEDTGGSRGPSRIEFDERLIQGQTNKANAIYLFERRESALRSLLKKRVDFHEEIEESLE